MKARQAVRSYGAITISARDPSTLTPLFEELEKRFWPGEVE